MPTYEYQCKNCGHELEEFQSMTEPPLTHCPNCDTENLARIMGAGAGVIFKGTGFYLTDYRKSGASPSGGEKKDTPKAGKAKDAGGSPPPAPKE
jgi:putative FmdB family regulatory protein